MRLCRCRHGSSRAARAIFVYLGKMLLPMDLSPFYPYSGNVFLLSPGYYLPLLLLIGITAAFLIHQ